MNKSCGESRNWRRARQRRGAALVEFALVLPILLLCIMGTLEVGRVVQVHQVLANAAREGARQGAADSPSTNVESVVRRYLKNQGLSSVEPQATVTSYTTETTPSGFPVYRVRVTLPTAAVSWTGAATFFGSGTQLIAEASWTRN